LRKSAGKKKSSHRAGAEGGTALFKEQRSRRVHLRVRTTGKGGRTTISWGACCNQKVTPRGAERQSKTENSEKERKRTTQKVGQKEKRSVQKGKGGAQVMLER